MTAIALFSAVRIITLSYGLDLRPDALAEEGDRRFWLSEQSPHDNDSLFGRLSKRDRERLLNHIRFPGDREALFGKEALVGLAIADHELTNWSGLKSLRENLPPGAEAILSAPQKDQEAENARKACLVWAYSAALADYLAKRLPEAKMGDEAASFLSDVILSGPLSLKPDDAFSVIETIIKESPGNKPLKSALSVYRKTCSLRFQASLRDYYALVEKTTGRVRELYLKGVEAYANEDYRTALFYWREVLKLDPDHEEAKRGAEKAERMLGK
ncbi:MAG: hypothetical protein ABIM74_00460 [candidate division WOR-3 bacterium]